MIKKLRKKLLIAGLAIAATAAPIAAPLAQPATAIAAEVKNGFYTENGVRQFYQNGTKVTTTGFVKSGTNWWYLVNGKVDYKKTGFVSGTVNGVKGNFYVSRNKAYGQAVQVDTAKWHELVPTKNTNFRLDIDGASPTTGANAFIFTKNGTIAQKFKFKGAGNGYYYILTAASGGTSALDSGHAPVNGQYTGPLLYQNTLVSGNKYQKWMPVKFFNGTYAFYNEQKGEFLDVSGENTYKDKVNVQTYKFLEADNGAEGQAWKIVDTTLTGFEKKDGKWIYYNKGVQSTAAHDIVEGTVNGTKGWYYIEKGVFKNTTTVINNKNGWFYVKNGKVDFGYTGFAKNSNGWWWIDKGQVTYKKNGFVNGTIDGKYNTYYVIDSRATGTLVDAPYTKTWVEFHLSENGNRMLDVLNAKADNGTNIQLCHRTNSAKAQSYYIVPSSDRYYYIYTGTENLKKVLDVSNGKKDGNVLQWQKHDGANQQWRFVRNFGSKADYRLINRATGESLTVAKDSSNVYSGKSEHTAVGKGRQKWTINKGAVPTWTTAKPATTTTITTTSTTNTAKQAFSHSDNTDPTVGGYTNGGSYSVTHHYANGCYYTKVTGTEPQLHVTGGAHIGEFSTVAKNVGAKAAIDAGMVFGDGNYYAYGKMYTNYWGNNEGNTLVLRTNGLLDSCHVNSNTIGKLGVRWAIKGLITMVYNGNVTNDVINAPAAYNPASKYSFIAQDYNGAYYIGACNDSILKSTLGYRLKSIIPNLRFAYCSEGGGHVRYTRAGGTYVVKGYDANRNIPGMIFFK